MADGLIPGYSTTVLLVNPALLALFTLWYWITVSRTRELLLVWAFTVNTDWEVRMGRFKTFRNSPHLLIFCRQATSYWGWSEVWAHTREGSKHTPYQGRTKTYLIPGRAQDVTYLIPGRVQAITYLIPGRAQDITYLIPGRAQDITYLIPGRALNIPHTRDSQKHTSYQGGSRT